MGKIISIVFIIAGVALALVGIFADSIFGGSPGISTPQLLIIISGVGLAVLGIVLFFDAVRHAIQRNGRQIIIISVPTLIVMIIMLEFMLMFAGFDTRYPIEVDEDFAIEGDWWVCDELGCHFEPIARAQACEVRNEGRTCDLNAQGFHDSDDFVPLSDHTDDELRILMLGDSFTFGASAGMGNSFVETLESNIPDALVWNVSMPGAGTNQEAEWLEIFDPMMQPDLVIVGFFMNDFEDNVYPSDSYFWGTTPDGRRLAIRKYRMNDAGEAEPITSATGLFYRLNSVEEPPNQIVRWIGITRVGSLILNTLNAIDLIRNQQEGIRWQAQVDATRQHLTRIADYATENNVPVVVLFIPDRRDLINRTTSYQTALRIFDDVGLHVLNPIEMLSRSSYSPPDVHWNTQGHQVVGYQLVDCVEAYQQTKSIADCVDAFHNN